MSITKYFTGLKRAYSAHRLRKIRIPASRWHDAIKQVPVLQGLSRAERQRLRELASEFLAIKTLNGANGLDVEEDMRILVAAQACLLLLGLDLSYFDGWSEVILYPDSFVVTRNETDDIGLVHQAQQVLGGEAWGRGPVILSWSDARPAAYPHGEGSNVILHEFAHKLDMLNGIANGMPPLHTDMNLKNWTRDFQHAYDQLKQALATYQYIDIDPYAAKNPAEYFAVTTEIFFENPRRLVRAFPAVYDQLRQFYRQDPLQRQ